MMGVSISGTLYFYAKLEGNAVMSKRISDEKNLKTIQNLVSGHRVGIIHLEMVREERSLYGMEQFQNASEAVETVHPLFEKADREMMVVMSLDVKNTPIAVEVVAVGGIDSCVIDVRNIFKHAVISNASGIICFHNHPSGVPEPSGEDMAITRRIKEAGNLLGISLLDHIIVGYDAYYSLEEHREL